MLPRLVLHGTRVLRFSGLQLKDCVGKLVKTSLSCDLNLNKLHFLKLRLLRIIFCQFLLLRGSSQTYIVDSASMCVHGLSARWPPRSMTERELFGAVATAPHFGTLCMTNFMRGGHRAVK